MQLAPKTLLRLGITTLIAMAVAAADPSEARAEVDTFALGDGHTGAKTVAGTETINSYAAITDDAAAGATTLTIGTTIGNAAGFAANDLILVWRATGIDAAEAPSGNQTKRIDLSTGLATTSSAASVAGLVGIYEFARIQSVVASTVTLTKPLVNGFTKLVTQIVRVPEYTDVTIPNGASLIATAWQEVGGVDASKPNPANPWAGGILIFLSNGTITNNGTIHANGRGFHGGVPVQRAINNVGIICDPSGLDGDPTTGAFSPKGEGVVHTKFLQTQGGKGNISMAGGGGDCLEAGGGGGANLGNGGIGSGTVGNLGSGGLGGVGIDFDLTSRLTMGGGGGGGRHLSGLISTASFGGFGGGVVYIRGGSMTGAGILQANGGNGEDTGLTVLPPNVASEGSGGGGAGGTIVVRLTGNLDCTTLGSVGGDGGSAEVIGIGIFGAGGGGGGGRVMFQTAQKGANCNVLVSPGNPGNNGQGGSKPGDPGGTQPGGGFCFGNTPGTPGACASPNPVCETTSGNCFKCTGPFGGQPPHPCPVNVDPVCLVDGTCVPCNGDFGSAATQACELGGSPTCFTTGGAAVVGSCGKCTTNADCTGPNHPGPICNVVVGQCGTQCTKDSDCKTTEWCAPQDATGGNVCIPKTPNGDPVPAIAPINGECTVEKGLRVCLSAVCEPSDDLCGLKNSSPCTDGTTFPDGGRNVSLQCRSSICFPSDELCGLPNGQPCDGDGQCRSAQCKGGICTGCTTDNDCNFGQVCDPSVNNCVPGCRPSVQSPTDGGQVHGGCPNGELCVSDGGPIGQCQPHGLGGDNDAGFGGDGGPIVVGDAAAVDTSGIVEGGGCSCSSTLSSATSPASILGVLCSSLLLMRRRKSRQLRKSRSERERSQRNQVKSDRKS